MNLQTSYCNNLLTTFPNAPISIIRIIALILAFTLAAQLFAYQQLKLNVSPKPVHIGDRTEINILLQLDEGEKFELATAMPNSPQLNFGETTWQQENNDQIRLMLVVYPYKVGNISLPELHFGQVKLANLSIKVESVLDKIGTAPYSYRPPLLPPGTVSILLLLLLLLLLIPILIHLVFLRWLLILLRFSRYHCYGLSHYLSFRRTLYRLTRRCASESGEQICRDISTEVRKYLSHQLQRPCTACTTHELAHFIYPAPSDPAWQQVIAILNYCDLVRFAHQYSACEERLQQLEQLRLLSRSLRAFSGKSSL